MTDTTTGKPDKNNLWKRYQRLIVACIVAGLVCGILTHFIEIAITFISSTLFRYLTPGRANIGFVILPVAGILLAIAYTHIFVKLPLSSGTERIRGYLAEKKYDLPARLVWAPAIGTSLTLGFGGSAGAEGPSAYAGAAIGSRTAGCFKLNEEEMRLMIGIGAGAGIAGIFRSPIGGVLFTLEVLRMPMTTLSVIGLITASLVAGLTAFILAGQQYEVVMLDSVTSSLSDVPYIILLGIILGFYSLYYNYIIGKSRIVFENIPNRWVRGLTAGLLTGVGIFIFPDLFSTGYSSLGKLLNGKYDTLISYSLFADISPTSENLILIALGIVILKAIVCGATNYSGGVAGNFAPTLFAGGFVGFIFATGFNIFLPTTLNVGNFVYIGMAGAMSGIIGAPLMSMFLTAEMCGHSIFLWSLAIVAIVSWGTTRITPLIRKRIKKETGLPT